MSKKRSLRGTIKKIAGFNKLIVSRITGHSFPLSVLMAITNRCNSRCRYCTYPNREMPDPTFEQLTKVIRDLVDLGTFRIYFQGGEPLLRKDIKEILLFTKNLGVSTSMISNGKLVPERLDVMRLLNEACISLDGPKEVMDANRGKNTFQWAVQACKSLKQEGINFHLNCVLTKNNADVATVRFLLDFAKKYGTRCVFIVMHDVPETTGEIAALQAGREKIQSVLDEIITAQSRGEPVLFSRDAYLKTRNWPDFSKTRMNSPELKKQGYPDCWAGKYSCYVDTDGTLYPCCLTVGVVPAKNAFEVGVKEALEVASRHNCKYCMSPPMIDFNSIFSLKAHALWHAFRHSRV